MINVSEYFDGNVKSLSLEVEGKKATSGVMAKGVYTFGTSSVEDMRIVAGVLEAKLPGEDVFTSYEAGTNFIVDANVSFDVKCDADVAYICIYG